MSTSLLTTPCTEQQTPRLLRMNFTLFSKQGLHRFDSKNAMCRETRIASQRTTSTFLSLQSLRTERNSKKSQVQTSLCLSPSPGKLLLSLGPCSSAGHSHFLTTELHIHALPPYYFLHLFDIISPKAPSHSRSPLP